MSSASNREFKLDCSLPHASSTPFTLWPADERHVAKPQDLSHHQPQDFLHHDQLQDFPHHDQLPDFMHPQQENLMGDQQNLARDQQPSPSSGYITPLYRLSWQAPNPLQHIAPSPPPLTPHLPSPEVVPMWIGDDDEFRALLAPPPDLEHLQSMSMGEIPGTHVIHDLLELQTDVVVQLDTRDQAISLSKELIVSIIFSNDALVSSPDDKKCIVKNMIIRVRPKIPALLVASHWTADDKDVKKIWSAVTKSRTAFATLICQAVVMGYSLLPPQGCNIAPDTFCIDRVRCLVMDNPLAFMHQYSFAGDGMLIIHTKFNNEFIIHILTQIIWCSTFRLHTFLEGSPRRQLHYAISAVGAITESVLIEQGKPHLAKGRITPQMTFPTFAKILSNLDKLN
ncbi:hypothetical protein BDR03DRAFT_988057, partial [Suillus americanus]